MTSYPTSAMSFVYPRNSEQGLNAQLKAAPAAPHETANAPALGLVSRTDQVPRRAVHTREG